MDDEFDFEIVCPYCDNEFLIDINGENSKIECPKCNNVIELDWSGNFEEEIQSFGCGAGRCSGCHGCGNTLINQKDEDDDM